MKASKFMNGEDQERDQRRIAAEQSQAKAANTDLREACRQYYWPHRSFTGPVADQIKILDGYSPHKRDVIMTAHGYPKDLKKKV